ncbi:MAG: META domain-containing protein [Chloroflexota bacterium]
MKRKILLLLVNTLVAAVLLLTACGPAVNTTPKPVPTLENTNWVLQSYGTPANLKSVLTSADGLKNIEITAVFDNAQGQVSGSSGVNTYGGSYELKDNKLSISGLIITLLGGPQPLIDQEKEFLKLLQAAESYQITDGRLQINCGQQMLVFTEKP